MEENVFFTINVEIWVSNQENLILWLYAISHFDLGDEAKILEQRRFGQIVELE